MKRFFVIILFSVKFNKVEAQTLKLFFPTVTASCNNTVDIPVKVKDFENILSLQFSIGWDTSHLRFQSIIIPNQPEILINNSNFGLTNTINGKLSFSWSDFDLSSESITDSSTLFSIRFSTSTQLFAFSNLDFINNPTLIEAVNSTFNAIPCEPSSGLCISVCNGIVYAFLGNGNWTDSVNWFNNSIPPPILPTGSRIIINPIEGGMCVLNTVQTTDDVTSIVVLQNKVFKILGNLEIR
jgi:hypothetical protein